MKRIGVLFEAEKKKKASKSDKPSYWRTVHGQHIGFDGDPPNGRPVIGPKQITKYLMVPRDESINEGVFTEASIAKMNRKKKAMDKKKKAVKKVKVRPAPFVPLAKSGASVQTMLQGRQKLIKAVEADAEGIKYASVSIIDVKKMDQEDILSGNLGVYLELNAEPPSAYEDVSGEVEIEVWCGGSGEDNFETSVDYEDDFANGSIQLGFIASLGKDGKPEYRMYDAQYRESDYFSDGFHFERIIKSVTGKVLTVADLDGLIDDELPSADSIFDAFSEYAQESDRFQDRYQDDCASTRGNYRY